jgi:hypothetical protein
LAKFENENDKSFEIDGLWEGSNKRQAEMASLKEGWILRLQLLGYIFFGLGGENLGLF